MPRKFTRNTRKVAMAMGSKVNESQIIWIEMSKRLKMVKPMEIEMTSMRAKIAKNLLSGSFSCL